MRNGKNLVLFELLIVVLLFALSATILVQVFSTAYTMSREAESITVALNEAQNVADLLYTVEDRDECLLHQGFICEDGRWTFDKEDLRIEVVLDEEETSEGVLRVGTVRVFEYEKELVSLPMTKYRRETGES